MATTQSSLRDIRTLARTRRGCYKTATTRNFVTWLFAFFQDAMWLFIFSQKPNSQIERNIYTWKNTVLQSSLITPDTPKTAAIVLELLEPLFGRGNTLWLDNLFNSPELVRRLNIKHSTDCVGTLKLNRMDVPKVVKIRKWKGGKA